MLFGHTHQPIFMLNGLIDVGSCKNVPFDNKNHNFFKSLTPVPKRENLADVRMWNIFIRFCLWNISSRL